MVLGIGVAGGLAQGTLEVQNGLAQCPLIVVGQAEVVVEFWGGLAQFPNALVQAYSGLKLAIFLSRDRLAPPNLGAVAVCSPCQSSPTTEQHPKQELTHGKRKVLIEKCTHWSNASSKATPA